MSKIDTSEVFWELFTQLDVTEWHETPVKTNEMLKSGEIQCYGQFINYFFFILNGLIAIIMEL